MFVTAKDCLGLAGMPTRIHNVRNKLNKLALDHQKRKCEGSKAFEYHIDCLPEATRLFLIQRDAKKQADAIEVQAPAKSEQISSDELWFDFDCSSDAKKDRAKKRLEVCLFVKGLVENNNTKMKAAMREAAEFFGHSYGAVHRWFYIAPGLQKNKIPVEDWLAALVDKQGLAVTRFAEFSPEAWSFFKADFLRPEQPVHAECYRRLEQAASRNGWAIPCSGTVKAWVDKHIPSEVITLTRGGRFAAKQTLIPAQRRSREGLHAMQIVSGDGHTFRLRVHLEDGGKVIRPTVWAFQDVYSSMIVGYSIDISENTEMLGIALYNMVSNFGIPDLFVLDRASASLGEAMTGRMSRPKQTKNGLVHKKFDTAEVEGAITAMGSSVSWSLVEDDNVGRKGNARSKPIERLFHSKGGIGQFERHPAFTGAYTGSSVVDKPANYGETSVHIDLVVEMFSQWVAEWNEEAKRRTELARGIYSYKQVFEQSYAVSQIRKPTDTQLRLCLLRTQKAVRVHEGGLVELNAGRYSQGRTNRYSSRLLFEYIGGKVNLRFNPYDLTKQVYAYGEDGKFIGPIPLNGDVAFNDLSAARRQSLMQEEALSSAEFMVSQMGLLSKEELKRLATSDKSSDELGGLVPGISQMVPDMDVSFMEEKRAVGHDASFEPQVDMSSDEVTASLVHLFGNK
ncbi:transposase domain-containing protein [Enterovibrio nigricans]|uniref:Mu DNA-binding domain-containing protein n=1 Tax=Enterovibrio nigricans DSM 22720 TaxID=1121868 RepID=A0A1T4VN66_9GAMM|nr:transposase domain-containing protein [Enterovibrio nigricans]SKA66376.1 Mu DNA-binding domain-containing protein [Enterovibrio nigricans DSM 22720]